jgi:hypothetical protein
MVRFQGDLTNESGPLKIAPPNTTQPKPAISGQLRTRGGEF